MGERKHGEELELIKAENNVMNLYSWSKFNTWERDTYEYFLKYIKREKEDRNNSIYGAFGGFVHDLIEDFYLDNVVMADMGKLYQDKALELDALGLKFDRSNKEKNDKIKVKYNSCNQHFFDNFVPVIGDNMKLEEFITINVGKFLFQGYIDASIEIDDKLHIIDWKTSTLYQGDKIIKERGQLLLYALGKIQEGWNIEDIVIGWMFTKYVYVDVPHKDGFKTRTIERNQIGSKLLASIRGQFKKCKAYSSDQVEEYINDLITSKSLDCMPNIIFDFVDEVELTTKGEIKKSFITKVRNILKEKTLYTEDERDEFCSDMILTNSIKCIPDEISSLYNVRNCFVEIPFTIEDIDALQSKIIKFIAKSERLKFEYSKSKDDSLFYQKVDGGDTYFLSNLCGYSAKLHKPYADYLNNRKSNNDLDRDEEMEKESSDKLNSELLELYAELGIDI